MKLSRKALVGLFAGAAWFGSQTIGVAIAADSGGYGSPAAAPAATAPATGATAPRRGSSPFCNVVSSGGRPPRFFDSEGESDYIIFHRFA